MAEHSKLFSPSSSHQWIPCAASAVLGASYPDTSSSYSEEGTEAHTIAAEGLTTTKQVVEVAPTVWDDAGGIWDDRTEAVQRYVDEIHACVQPGDDLFVEQTVRFGPLVGIDDPDDGFGTADAVILSYKAREVQVRDLKFGKGVRVDAEDNTQALLYTLGVIHNFSPVIDFEKDVDTIRIGIHQPRLNHSPEWVITPGQLWKWVEETLAPAVARVKEAKQEAERTGRVPDRFFNPGEKQCRFCKVKADCPALSNYVLTTVADDFVDTTKPVEPQLGGALERIHNCDDQHLDNIYPALDMIADWVLAVRGRIEARLLEGAEFSTCKLVEGRLGSRSWTSEEAAEAMLKSMRLKVEEMYNLKVISPTQAEKVLKKSPRRWTRLQDLITRKPGKNHVAPMSDKRPAINVADDFESTTTEGELA